MILFLSLATVFGFALGFAFGRNMRLSAEIVAIRDEYKAIHERLLAVIAKWQSKV